jgi:hypothetical protein
MLNQVRLFAKLMQRLARKTVKIKRETTGIFYSILTEKTVHAKQAIHDSYLVPVLIHSR